MHLRALYRIAIAIVFDETEGCSEPVDRLGKAPVSDVGKHGVNRNRAILQHGKKIRQPDFCIKRCERRAPLMIYSAAAPP